jgi:phage baseplate assembly protein W
MTLFSDFRLEFDIHPIRKDLILVTDEVAVIQSIRNLIMTNHFESPFQPEKGCNIRRQLFEPASTFIAADIARWIRETITNYEPRATVSRVSVSPTQNNQGYEVDIEVFIDTSATPTTVNFFLERIR